MARTKRPGRMSTGGRRQNPSNEEIVEKQRELCAFYREIELCTTDLIKALPIDLLKDNQIVLDMIDDLKENLQALVELNNWFLSTRIGRDAFDKMVQSDDEDDDDENSKSNEPENEDDEHEIDLTKD